MEQDRTVVLAVIGFLGLVVMVGLIGLIWLVHDKTDAVALVVISTPTSAALGALAGILATTKSNPSPASVRQQTLDDVAALTPPSQLPPGS